MTGRILSGLTVIAALATLATEGITQRWCAAAVVVLAVVRLINN